MKCSSIILLFLVIVGTVLSNQQSQERRKLKAKVPKELKAQKAPKEHKAHKVPEAPKEPKKSKANKTPKTLFDNKFSIAKPNLPFSNNINVA